MKSWMRIIKESSIGTTPTPDSTNSVWIDNGTNAFSVFNKPTVTTVRTALPKRGMTKRKSFSTQDNISGTVSTKLYHEQAQFWHDVVLEPTVSVTAPYPGSLPTVTIAQGYTNDDGSLLKYEQYSRCILTQATLSGSNAGEDAQIKLAVNVMGGEQVADVTVAPPSCSDFPVKAVLWSGLIFKLNNVELQNYLDSLTLTLAHEVSKLQHTTRYPLKYIWSGWNPSLSVTMDLANHTYRDKHLAIRTAFADAIYATNNVIDFVYDSDEKTTFNFFNAFFDSLDPDLTPTGPHKQSAQISPYFDCTNLDMTCTITNPA